MSAAKNNAEVPSSDKASTNPPFISAKQTIQRSERAVDGSRLDRDATTARLRKLVRELPQVTNRPAFVFCTSGSAEPGMLPYTRRFQDLLARKGYDVVGSFSCRGFDSWLPLKIFGGLNKGKPDAADLDRARTFARELLATRLGPQGAVRGHVGQE